MIRILTANLRRDRADPAALARIIEELEVDVACVQELGAHLAEALGRLLPEGRLGPEPSNTGLGIACRHPAEVRQFPLPKRPGWAARLSPSHWSQLREPIEIVNVHIMGPHTWPYFPKRHTRSGQLAGLLRYLEEEPHVPRAVLGDFNASPLWPFYRSMAARFTDSVAACASQGASRHRTWPRVRALGLDGLIRIDHCFVSRLAARHARVVPLPGSDHLGLCVDLTLT